MQNCTVAGIQNVIPLHISTPILYHWIIINQIFMNCTSSVETSFYPRYFPLLPWTELPVSKLQKKTFHTKGSVKSTRFYQEKIEPSNNCERVYSHVFLTNQETCLHCTFKQMNQLWFDEKCFPEIEIVSIRRHIWYVYIHPATNKQQNKQVHQPRNKPFIHDVQFNVLLTLEKVL